MVQCHWQGLHHAFPPLTIQKLIIMHLKVSECMPRLLELELRLGSDPFFGGATPHLGDFGLFHLVDCMMTLMGDEPTLERFKHGFPKWIKRMAALKGVQTWMARRTPPGCLGVGYPDSIIDNYAVPSQRPDMPALGHSKL